MRRERHVVGVCHVGDPTRLELWKSFVKEGEIIEKGWITVPERPGLGVEMNEEAARKAQIKGTPWFEPAA